jgi:hypothetical protein
MSTSWSGRMIASAAARCAESGWESCGRWARQGGRQCRADRLLWNRRLLRNGGRNERQDGLYPGERLHIWPGESARRLFRSSVGSRHA